jgi:hypothetical protein
MNAYLVRHAAEHDHQIVGIFVCHLRELWDHIDAVSDVGMCEYATLGAGGIEWPSPRAPKLPLRDYDDETDSESEPLSFAEASLSELWRDPFYGRDTTWHPIPLPGDAPAHEQAEGVH